MFELRWLSEKINVPLDKRVYGPNIAKEETVRTLQFRQMSNIEEIGVQPPIWTEWEDVPEESE